MVVKKLSTIVVILSLVFACNQAPPLEPTSEINPTTNNTSDLENFAQTVQPASFGQSVRVMTRNIYVGTDVDIILSAENPQDIPLLAAQSFQGLLATRFPERALSLAKEVALTKPDLIGLQEVALIRIQSPGDAIVGGTVPAEQVFMNYLDIFMQALQALGQEYKIAATITNADVEVPMLTGTDPLTFDDVRLTDSDVILVKENVEVTNESSANYQNNLIIPDLGLEILRGYAAIDAKVGMRSYRFVNTHLEPFALPIKMAQARELTAVLAGESLPVIMAGDFNSQAPQSSVYKYIIGQGYQDIWPMNALTDNPDGFTYGHEPDLLNPAANFYERIDHIYVRYGNSASPLHVLGIVVGDEAFNRTPSGLWPSDHGGVVARLRIPNGDLSRIVALRNQ